MWKTAFIWTVLLFLAYAQPVKAGWVITTQSSDSFGNKSYSTTFIQDSIIRIDKPTSISIINFNQKLITLIFAQHRAYWQGTAQDLNKTTSQMAEEQLTKLLAFAPEQKRQAIKRALESFKKAQAKPDSLRVSPNVTVRRMSRKDTLLGYPSTEYEVIIDSIVKQHVWVTQKVKPYHEADIDRIMAFSKALNPFSMENSLNRSKSYRKLLEEGVILKSINYTTNGNKLVTTVTKVRKMNIPVAIFQIPPGYVMTSLENVMILDMKNNILDPKNLTPGDGSADDGMPELPHNNDINQNPF
jgi:hypothetical protein